MRIDLIISVFFLVLSNAVPSLADSIAERLPFWEAQAYFCTKGVAEKFPSKSRNDESNPCDDGDMTLFNGLLCHAGDERGCAAVRDAQDSASGEWHRSPRIRAIGKNDQGEANSSPDMALGIQLYLIKTKDIARAEKWLRWIHEHVPCSIEIAGSCVLQGLPRFCTEVKGCTIRPGDAAVLSATVDYLQKTAGLPTLPDGRLRGILGSFAGYGSTIAEIDSWVNEEGFPRHLVAVAITTLRAAGLGDSKLDNAAKNLDSGNQDNAFFAYVADGKSAKATELTLKRCPTPKAPSQTPLNEWQWERNADKQPWLHSMYWDCIFMAHLLK